VGHAPTSDLFAEAGSQDAAEAQPISDLRGSADYRRDVGEVLTAGALEQACKRAKGTC